MLEINQMNNKDKKETSLLYKVVRVALMFLSAIIMLSFLAGVVGYITSGPSTTLWDDLTTEFVIQTLLMGFCLFYLIVAWFRHISYGIVALVFAVLYVGYTSLLAGSITVGFLPIAMAFDAVGFILLGIIHRARKESEYNIYAEPIINDLEGPDIFNFKV